MEVWISCIGYQGMGKASDFHSKCDNKGETIAVIQSTSGFIFGGFSDKPWASSGKKLCESDKDFLFSLNITSNKVGTRKIL